MLLPCNMRGDRAHPILADSCLTPYGNKVKKECFSGKSIPALLAVKVWEQPQKARKGTKSYTALTLHGSTPSLCLLPLSLCLYPSLQKALVSKGYHKNMKYTGHTLLPTNRLKLGCKALLSHLEGRKITAFHRNYFTFSRNCMFI